MAKHLAVVAVVGILTSVLIRQAPAQERIGERLGEKLDKGLSRLSAELREEWVQMKKSVERMGVHGRVYSRLRWDKGLEGASFEIEVRDKATVVLTGKVGSAAAKVKAVQLAQDTVGVSEVVDQLTVEAPAE
jgi:hypothetical protein